MNDSIINIKTFFKKGTFVIPNFQRGFKWGVPKKKSDAVSVLIGNLIDAYKNGLSEYFIQGVTVYEEEKEDDNKSKRIILIDGQQRTTTFYLLLKILGENDLLKINYNIRKESDNFLKEIKINDNFFTSAKVPEHFSKNDNEELQDIFYFKKAIRTIHQKLTQKDENNKLVDLNLFKEFVLEKVKLFYITIAPEKATKVFLMMNCQKAMMKNDELIKSALLSKASRANHIQENENVSNANLTDLLQIIKNKVGEEWEINALRSKYAREWDKWLYWWNRDDVSEFFGSKGSPLGLLLEYYFELNKGKENKDNYYDSNRDKDNSYKSFYLFNETFFDDIKKIKSHFKRIRDLQKMFEDWYNDPETYNYLGLILKTCNDKKEALLYFLSDLNDKVSMSDYAKMTLINTTHIEIIKREEITKTKAENVLNILSQTYVYLNENDEEFDEGRKEMSFRQLLRINVELDNKLNRKFDFSIWSNRSLEHIFPKSRKNEIDWRNKNSVHCIGNLVLLYGRDNSSFGALDFDDKKKKLFSCFYKENENKEEKARKNILKSNSLLHTISVFSNKEWKHKQIEKNKEDFIDKFEKCYDVKLNAEGGIDEQ